MEPSLKVLILEDVADDAKLIERALRGAGVVFAARRVDTREDFARALQEWHPDVILTDYRLPQFDGIAALKLVRECLPETPAIVVSGTLTDEVAVGLLREGAYDYVMKDRLARLGSAVRRAIDAARNDAAEREARERHRLLFDEARDGIALVDATTGRVAEANGEFERQTGRALGELRNLPVWELWPPFAVEAERMRFKSMAENGASVNWEIEALRPDGTELPLELRAKVVTLRGKRFVMVASRDISERRAAERLLHGQLDELRRFQRVTVDRELRLQELEQELRRLKSKAIA